MRPCWSMGMPSFRATMALISRTFSSGPTSSVSDLPVRVRTKMRKTMRMRCSWAWGWTLHSQSTASSASCRPSKSSSCCQGGIRSWASICSRTALAVSSACTSSASVLPESRTTKIRNGAVGGGPRSNDTNASPSPSPSSCRRREEGCLRSSAEEGGGPFPLPPRAFPGFSEAFPKRLPGKSWTDSAAKGVTSSISSNSASAQATSQRRSMAEMLWRLKRPCS
mmetsp:Transcript_24221/g.43328  ORF Transcript_24221/g.43328 Transcript_24221/m.43328 type:complete len:223 (-) Transcript_24221:114-782(-)